MQMGCGTYLFLMVWGMGVVCTIGGFIVQPRSQAPTFFGIGIVCLIVAIIWTKSMVGAPKRAAREAQEKKRKAQRDAEAEQERLAHISGLEKYHTMDLDDARKYQEGVEAMRQLGMIMQQSVVQEKERSWATWGGAASGIAGPIAGVGTALSVMQQNAEIRARNAANREWGARQNAFYQDLASQAEAKRPTALSMAELQKQYAAVFAWSPRKLLKKLDIRTKSVEIDPETGAVTVTADWKQSDTSVCIDGAVRAKLYTSAGACAGCAYLVLPKAGTARHSGTLSGVCAEPKPSDAYTVRYEPVDLWELASVKNGSACPENLSEAEHRRIAQELEEAYQAELLL